MAKFRFEAGKKEDERQNKYQQKSAMADTNVMQKVDGIIEKALELRATEVHFEPRVEDVCVRARVEGALEEIETFPLQLVSKIINRIKVLSAMDITKAKLPQSGFFKVITDENKIEILSQTFPTLRGEKALLDIQYKTGVTHELEDLGMLPSMLEEYREMLGKPNGLILVAGPPGSGKNTTLYATLQYLNSPQKSVATFEPVVKYEIPGIIQSKPDDKVEFTFEEGVKAILNTKPDVLLLGEMQSPEVARAAVQGAFGRRIVLGRMAADNSVNALQNMVDMGIQPFLVTSAVTAVLAQRLVRRLCDNCKEEYEPPQQLSQELGLRSGMTFYRPKGCPECSQMGYNGFIGVFEFLMMHEDLSEMFIARESSRQIRSKALKLGMVPLKKDGIYKACKGKTSIEEVLNAL